MNRFSRLVGLRRIREEANGMAFARTLARMEGLQQDMIRLDQQTQEEQGLVRQTLADDAGGRETGPSGRLALGLVDNFLRGQAWRRQRLEQMIAVAQLDLEKSKEAWLAARTQLQQAEKLAEKEALHQHQRVEHDEKKAMDMVGVLRNRNFSGQEGELG
ncbi:MAG: hypothetical protein HQL87_11305 [Magnetococcales bacterium]|nr:hypothetical protein [Magnetococcales bacterium]